MTKGERNPAPEHPAERAGDPRLDSTIAGLGQAVIEAIRLNSEALRQNAEISMRAVDRLPQLMEAMTTMLNVASGTGLHAVQQRELPPALRNAANDNDDDVDEEEDDEEGDEEAPPPAFGGFPMPPGFDINKIISQVAFDVVSKLIEKFSGKMPSAAAILDPRIAYEEGQRERAAQAAAQQATVVRAPGAPRGPRVPSGASVRSAPPPVAHPAANDVPTDPVSLAHFYAVKNALTRDEQALVVSIAQELSDDERAAWFNELLPLSVPEAVATVRTTLGQLLSQTPAPPSLTTAPPTSRPADQGPPPQSPAAGPSSPTQANGQSRAS